VRALTALGVRAVSSFGLWDPLRLLADAALPHVSLFVSLLLS